MKILLVVGARPNFMKAAPIIAAIDEFNERARLARESPWCENPVSQVLVHTGQHYDERMSDAFFRDLNLPLPDIHLGVGSGSHAAQTAEVMKKFESVLLAEAPQVVIVVGDVNSTLACALVTAKICVGSGNARPLIAHVEAGLRSFDRSMPEEVNRILTDQVSDLLFVTEESAVRNLREEGVPPSKVYFVGNTMIDSLLAFREKAETSSILDTLKLRRPGSTNGGGKSIHPYSLLTLHRPSNVDDRGSLLGILAGLSELAMNQPIIFPVHPRTRKRIEEFDVCFQAVDDGMHVNPKGEGAGTPCGGFVLTDPLGYLDFLCLMKHARLVVTDSGGIQEETTSLGIPCVTVRNNTERPVTIHNGTNILAGTDKDRIREAVRRQIARKAVDLPYPEKWDGHAARRIVATLVQCQELANANLTLQTVSA